MERVSSIDVMVDLEKADQPVVEVVVATELKKDFRADYSSGDLWGCLDQTIDKIEQQMRKFKEKMTEHR
ncbi:MAG: HPF/RaiA family ribosome-associated protein [Thermoguttaceae bacterium]|nr:HPF/RaiA family ribosome-associated protein [Thermoguttaceae bacterium]